MNKIIMKKIKRHKILSIISTHIKEYRRYYLISTILFLIGFIVGIIIINNTNQEQISEVKEYIIELNNNLKNTEQIDYIYLLKNSFYSNFTIILIIWIASSTVIGIPVVYCQVAYRGFVLGYTISSVLITYGAKEGIFYNLSTLLLHNIIFIPVLLATAVSGMKTYKLIIKNREKENIKSEFLRHTVFSLIMLILLLFSSILEVYFSTNLSRFVLKFIKI